MMSTEKSPPKKLYEKMLEMADERNQEIIRLYKAGGWTYQQLADKFGISKQRVEKIVNKGK